ncbi:hypothetical protein EJ02DRAFT_466247 [Clathrospora elynae]|uniref:Uncharacterized protein n=1 Tax=Clathrospora elynae TaxID=706981 RepID=A0A6A5SQJ4_9PLEO|nr:hypothetical protein EJ02DRAFT_466247 [Clathrospora elynae]
MLCSLRRAEQSKERPRSNAIKAYCWLSNDVGVVAEEASGDRPFSRHVWSAAENLPVAQSYLEDVTARARMASVVPSFVAMTATKLCMAAKQRRHWWLTVVTNRRTASRGSQTAAVSRRPTRSRSNTGPASPRAKSATNARIAPHGVPVGQTVDVPNIPASSLAICSLQLCRVPASPICMASPALAHTERLEQGGVRPASGIQAGMPCIAPFGGRGEQICAGNGFRSFLCRSQQA